MRYIKPMVLEDLKRKMVFIGGPRQCGKTTLAKDIVGIKSLGASYLNFDNGDDRQTIVKKNWDFTQPLIVFDELHKMLKWKTWIKGIYDKAEHQNYLVTGSARLDIFRRAGDSLMGRYHYWRLHPFGLDEIPENMTPQEAFNRLMSVGGFPEPFLDGSERFAKRWRKERLSRVIREDVQTLENIRHLQQLEFLLEALRGRVGSTVSLNNLAQDLQVSQPTVESWINLMERLYLIFSVKPFVSKLFSGIKKAKKIYFYDNNDVNSSMDKSIGARFENLIATHLLKRIHFLEDYEGDSWELCYLREKDSKEVDFALVKNKKVVEIVEAKYGEDKPSSFLMKMAEKFQLKTATLITTNTKKSTYVRNVNIITPEEYFASIRGSY